MNDDEYDDIIRTLVSIASHQDSMNADVRESLRQQGTINERLTASMERLEHSIARIDHSIERLETTLAHVEITQARMETLLARMLRHEDNGR